MHDHGTESRSHLYSTLLGATFPACALKQGLICFNLRQAEQTLTIGTLNIYGMHVTGMRQFGLRYAT